MKCYELVRTTISLEDRLAEQVRREAATKGVSVNAFIVATLKDAIKRRTVPTEPKPFRLITVGGDGLRSGIDLDRPRAIESADDEARFRLRDS